MLTHRRLRLPAITLATGAILTGLVVASSPANAASSPIAACGGGSYHEIDHHDFGATATIHLLYNGTTDCVVTWNNHPDGSKMWLAAALQTKADLDGPYDADYYAYYAGPVKLNAPGVCIRWSGAAGEDTVWDSEWSHCG